MLAEPAGGWTVYRITTDGQNLYATGSVDAYGQYSIMRINIDSHTSEFLAGFPREPGSPNGLTRVGNQLYFAGSTTLYGEEVYSVPVGQIAMPSPTPLPSASPSPSPSPAPTDFCLSDPLKLVPGVCGCGVPDVV